MPHDANNKKLRVGHRVMLPLTIQEITSDHPGVCNIKATDSKGNVVAYDSSAVVLHPDERAADESFTPPIPNIMKSSIETKLPSEKEAKAANRIENDAPETKAPPLDPLEPKGDMANAGQQPIDNRSADEKAADDKLKE